MEKDDAIDLSSTSLKTAHFGEVKEKEKGGQMYILEVMKKDDFSQPQQRWIKIFCRQKPETWKRKAFIELHHDADPARYHLPNSAYVAITEEEKNKLTRPTNEIEKEIKEYETKEYETKQIEIDEIIKKRDTWLEIRRRNQEERLKLPGPKNPTHYIIGRPHK